MAIHENLKKCTDATMYSGTWLFQPRLGAAKLAGLVRWLDLRVWLLCETIIQVDQSVPKQLGGFGCISEAWISEVPLYTD